MVQRATCACPNCQRSIAVQDAFAPGNRLVCPDCRHGFVWPTPQPEANTDVSAFQTQLDNQAPSAAPLPNVGRFEIRRVLAEGTFGSVYLAFDPQFNRIVALKVAKLDGDSKTRVERFLRQAESAVELRHTHIVPLFDYGSEGGQFYLALAFIRGRGLDRYLSELNANNQTMKPGQAANITLHLAEALAYAHSRGIVHGDVNPHNVMLDENGDPLLMDFGLASRPENQDGASENTAARDQFSLGSTMYELLTGETPFDGNPGAPSTRNPRVPRDLDAICLKCLEKDPAKRYADCRALLEDLRRFQKGASIQARRSRSLAEAGKWARGKLVTALLLLLVLGGISAVVHPIYTGAFGDWFDQMTAGMRFDDAMSRGDKAEKKKDYAAAVEAFETALKIRPHDGDALTAKKRVEEALVKEQKEQEKWRRDRGEEPLPKLAFPK